MNHARVVAALLTVGMLACGGESAHTKSKHVSVPSKYPALPKGCAVDVFDATPSMATEDIGQVRATCQDIVSEEDCVRELKDQACALGANVVWGVTEESRALRRPSGRAAHTK